MEYEFHELADLFPLLGASELQELAEDIQTNGQNEPVVLYDGKILDGRNRYLACRIAAIEPTFREYSGNDPLRFVISANLKRRHLSPSQCAALAVELLPMLEAEARKRQATSTGGSHPQLRENFPEGAGKSSEQAASLVGSNPHSISDAKAVKEQAPDLFKKIQAGELTVHKAKQEIRRERQRERLVEIEQSPVKPLDGFYDVIVVDPPWPIQKIERDVRPNQVLFDYPVLQVPEIASLTIPCTEHCHLWLWTTQKYLPDAFDILKQWQFKYVCTFVWHKPGGPQPFELPQYNCEFALYARRGSPLFVDLKDFKLCFDAPRGEHSEKPTGFYEMVCRVTAGRRLDMFNRKPIDGFEGWGNQA